MNERHDFGGCALNHPRLSLLAEVHSEPWHKPSQNCFLPGACAMKYSIILATVAFFLSLCAAEADPMPVGSETMPLQGGPTRPTPEWAKAHPKLTTAQTAKVIHSCNKDRHSSHCVKKCVMKATEVQPSGPLPEWHVRAGQSFAVRDKQAENAMLGETYSPKVERKRQVQATVLKAP